VQYTSRTAYTEYSIHRLQHALNAAYTTHCIIPRSTFLRSQPVFHLSADHAELISLPSHNYEVTNESILSSHRPSLPNYRLQIDHLQVLRTSRSIIASESIYQLAGSQCQSKSLSQLNPDFQVHVQSRAITATQCNSEFTQSLCPIASQNSLDHCLQVHFQPGSITASKSISEFTRSQFSAVCPNSVDLIVTAHLWVPQSWYHQQRPEFPSETPGCSGRL
jgi:hypothetical protein